ncbi:MAG TPA: hypothetical protein VEJ18_19265, partial [Planctomycetota bacterium]|nr:hypothetical protein [Planctomycetota bacterium]
MIIYGWTMLGRSDLKTRQAPCPACGRPSTLSSYVARRWVTLFFIPIVPLSRQHASDVCGTCKLGRFMPESEWQTRKQSALEEAARKAHAEPRNGEAQLGLLSACLVFEEWDKAEAFLKRLEEGFANDANVQVGLAQAYGYLGRAREAAGALARAQALDPAVAVPKPPVPPLPRGAGTVRQLAGAAVLAVAVVLFAAGYSVYKSNSRELHIVSGLEAPVTVHVEGAPPVTLSKGRRTITVAEGRRKVRLTGAVEDTVEIVLQSGFVERLFDDRTFILNPGGAAVLVLEEAAYAKRTEDAKGERPPKLLYGRPFEVLEDVDYLFKPFPQQISTKSTGITIKRRIDVVDAPAAGVMMWLSGNDRAGEALGFAEWALRARPSHRADVAPAYVSLARRS